MEKADLTVKEQMVSYLWRNFNNKDIHSNIEIHYLLPSGSIAEFMKNGLNDHVHRVLLNYLTYKTYPNMHHLPVWIKTLPSSSILECKRLLLVDGDNIMERLWQLKGSLLPLLNSMKEGSFHMLMFCCTTNFHYDYHLDFAHLPYVTIISVGTNGNDLVDHAISMMAGQLDAYMTMMKNNGRLALVTNDKFAIESAKLMNMCGRKTSVISSGSGRNMKLEKLFNGITEFIQSALVPSAAAPEFVPSFVNGNTTSHITHNPSSKAQVFPITKKLRPLAIPILPPNENEGGIKGNCNDSHVDN